MVEGRAWHTEGKVREEGQGGTTGPIVNAPDTIQARATLSFEADNRNMKHEVALKINTAVKG